MNTKLPKLPMKSKETTLSQEHVFHGTNGVDKENERKRTESLCLQQEDVEPQSTLIQHRRQSVVANQLPCSSDRSHRRNRSADFALLRNNSPVFESPGEDDLDGRFPLLPPRQAQNRNDVRQEAQELLNNFAVQEFQRRGITPPEVLSSGFTNAAWTRTGQDLRILAEAFSKSQERDIVRRRAQKVRMEAITLENFFSLCAELFKEGISQERIVVLFTFVSDIAIYHVLEGGHRFVRRLMNWSLRYICSRICLWVQENGGWGAVLSVGANLIYKCTMFVCAALAITACGIYITKTLKNQ